MSTLIRVGAANIVCGVKNAYETVEILSENLNNLMAEHPEFGSNMLLEKHSGGKVKKSTAHRIRTKQSACDISTLSGIAQTFGLVPWQLLIPGLDPKNR